MSKTQRRIKTGYNLIQGDLPREEMLGTCYDFDVFSRTADRARSLLDLVATEDERQTIIARLTDDITGAVVLNSSVIEGGENKHRFRAKWTAGFINKLLQEVDPYANHPLLRSEEVEDLMTRHSEVPNGLHNENRERDVANLTVLSAVAFIADSMIGKTGTLYDYQCNVMTEQEQIA